ncbi:bleomycin resistance protein [Streptomyces sp. CBMA29]|nr:VOC family protein [Streptomyces sp. CBMA29]MBD0734740.1 bleomycin resistance protein [Streptomyces sp. CBMA29]
MSTRQSPRPGTGATSSDAVFGAPCWVSLTSRDLAATHRFYAAVLGWTYRGTKLGGRFSVALDDGRPVAGIAELASAWQVPVAWTPYFAVEDADETAARIRERSGTVAVGPIAFESGRAALAADRNGAVFGIWEGLLSESWPRWRDEQPVWLRLRTPDPFEAAIFYGEVLLWASDRPGACEVAYEGDEVVLRSAGRVVARLGRGAVQAAPDPVERPHWEVFFTLRDLPAALRAVRANGGGVVAHHAGPAGESAVVRDPDGGLFTLTAPEGT